jgi:hypothetical protein
MLSSDPFGLQASFHEPTYPSKFNVHYLQPILYTGQFYLTFDIYLIK